MGKMEGNEGLEQKQYIVLISPRYLEKPIREHFIAQWIQRQHAKKPKGAATFASDLSREINRSRLNDKKIQTHWILLKWPDLQNRLARNCSALKRVVLFLIWFDF